MSDSTLVRRLRELASRIAIAFVVTMVLIPGLATRAAAADHDHTAFVRLLVPKTQLYVGELLPVQIKGYFRTDVGVSLNAPPTLRNDAFTTSNLTSPPAQAHELIDGVPYMVVTWPSAVVPIKNGNYTLALEVPVTLQIRQPTTPRPATLDELFGPNPLNGPLFNNSALRSYFSRVIEKSVVLKADAIAVDVLPLPAAGRPADFSGAVGSFDVGANATPTKIAAGDPLTVTLNIRGEGNFDRVNSNVLSTDAEWKTYRPRASFSPRDKIGLRGSKKFEQAVVPLGSGAVTLPVLDFSYFDPRLRQYIVRRTQPITVSVQGAQNPPGNATSNTTTSASAGSGRAPGGTLFAPNRLATGPFKPTLRPLVQQPWFLTLPGVPLALMAAGLLFFNRRTRLASDASRADDAARSRVAAVLASMDDALRAGDGDAFMVAARTALQLRLGRLWSLEPTAVSLAEVDTRLDSSWQPVRDVFQLADQVAYGGVRPEVATLASWRQTIRDQLQRLGKS